MQNRDSNSSSQSVLLKVVISILVSLTSFVLSQQQQQQQQQEEEWLHWLVNPASFKEAIPMDLSSVEEFPIPTGKYVFWGLNDMELLYKKNPPVRLVPKFKPTNKITVEVFHQHFRKLGRPVIIPFECLSNIKNFSMKALTMEELELLFPFDEEENKTSTYRANALVKKSSNLDLAQAIHNIARDVSLVRMENGARNYPRNMHVNPAALSKLGIQAPPLIVHKDSSSRYFNLPSLWFGPTDKNADTKFHTDPGDNFVQMLVGRKRIVLAPPTDYRLLNPTCSLKAGLCWANFKFPFVERSLKEWEKTLLKRLNTIDFTLNAGEMLYIPSGWFHAVQNVKPSIMVNWWTINLQQIGLFAENNVKIQILPTIGNY